MTRNSTILEKKKKKRKKEIISILMVAIIDIDLAMKFATKGIFTRILTQAP